MMQSNAPVSRVRKIAFTAIGVALAVFAYLSAASAYYSSYDKAQAPVFVQTQPAFQMEALGRGIDPRNPEVAQPRLIATLARQTLQDDPLNAEAIRSLGMASATDSAGPTERYLRIAEKVSRRDLATQLGLLTVEVANNDAPKAMTHLDRALSVRPQVVDDISPYLVALLGSAEGRDAIGAYMTRPWFDDFVKIASSSAEAPQNLARALLSKPEAIDRLDAAAIHTLMGRTARAGFFDEASRLARATGLRSEALQAFDFSDETVSDRFAPLTWNFVRSPDIETVLSTRGYAEITLFSDKRSLALERVTNLPTGTKAMSIGAEQSGGNAPTAEWRLSCLRNGEADEAASYAFDVGRADETHALSMAIPASCPVQLWSLWLRDDATQPATIRFWINERS